MQVFGHLDEIGCQFIDLDMVQAELGGAGGALGFVQFAPQFASGLEQVTVAPALEAAEMLLKEGIGCRVLNMSTLKPMIFFVSNGSTGGGMTRFILCQKGTASRGSYPALAINERPI
jgi:hypothetical protein